MDERKQYSFFRHRECECFPCHSGVPEDEFNCLFCYCPLYALGDECGGEFSYLENGVKNCSECPMPHMADNYWKMIENCDKVVDIVRKKV